jgi:hypothetical protein
MSSKPHSRQFLSISVAFVAASVALVTTLMGLGSASEVVAAPIQDDGRGQWTDPFTDASGLSVAVNAVVNATQTRLEIAPPTTFSQTDWSGGDGLISTTATSTNRYSAGVRVNPVVSGSLSLGFTLPATDSTAALKQDAYPDLVINNYYSGTELVDGAPATDSYIYYGSEAGFSDINRVQLPITAAAASAIADLNNDGFLDIVMARDNRDNDPSNVYIYWGSDHGYSESNRDEFGPAGYLGGCAVLADFDQDGYLDMLICNYLDASDPNPANWNFAIDSYIYWGSSTGYTISNRSTIPTVGAVAAYAADLNKDGHLDLSFSNYQNSLDKSLTSTFAISSYVYWGDGTHTGYTTSHRTELPTIGAYGNSVADLNRDGYPDIVFSNRRIGGGDVATTTYQIDSYVYWGSSAGFSPTNRLELPTLGSYGNSLADLNGDGWPEIIFSNHYDGITHSINSYIYWNNAGTFTTSNRTELPTLGATGNCAGDLNFDGSPDIVFANRRLGADHNVPSYVYWGSSDGYTTTHRTSLNTHGAIGCSIAGGTIAAATNAYGNVYALPITGSTTITDTAFTPRIYATNGVITSTGFDSGGTHTWQQITWNTTIPSGTNLALDVATSADGLTWSAWSQAASSSVDGANSASLSVAAARFIRYRATLAASADHQQTPILQDIQIIGGYTGGNATSVLITPTSLDRWDVVTWTAQVVAGQAITVQVLDSSSNLIPDGILPGNSAGYSTSPISISALNISTYSSLRLRAWLRSNSVTSTPSLGDWSVAWFVVPSSLTIAPSGGTITAGTSQAYTVTAHDNYGRAWDVTASSQFTISPSAGGIWMANVYTSAVAGIWTVTGTHHGVLTTTGLTVQHGPAVSLDITPGTATVTAGSTTAYTLTAHDAYNNTWDATSSGTYTITPAAGGFWAANMYTSQLTGTWTVTGSYAGRSATATLTVNSAALDHVGLAPATASHNAGQSIAYTLTAYDAYGNAWDVTSSGTYTITPTAGGSWATNLYTSQAAGTWTITGTYTSRFATATLIVGPGTATSIMVSPASVSLNPGAGQVFTATGYDTFGNFIPALNANWSIRNGGGSITPPSAGVSAVTVTAVVTDATYANTLAATTGSVTGTATIIVNNVAPTAAILGTYTGNEGSSIALTGSGADANNDPITYTWSFGDGQTGTGVAPTHTYTDEGYYNAVLTVTDDQGAIGTSTTVVTISNVAPTAVISAPSTASGGEEVTFDGSLSHDPGADTLTFAWDFNGDDTFGDKSGAVVTYTFTHSGTYAIGLRVDDGDGGQNVATHTIQITSNASDAYSTYLPIIFR